MTVDGPFLSLSEAAKRVDVSRMSLRRRVNRGELDVFEDPLDGRKRLVRTADLDRLRQPRPVRRDQLAEISAA